MRGQDAFVIGGKIMPPREEATMQASSSIDIERALSDPKAVFKEPSEVVALPDLPRETKLAILREWEQDARSMSRSESEGMGGGADSMLGRVELAIATVTRGTHG